MRRVILVLFLVFAGVGYSGVREHCEKASQGILNILLSPLEIPATVLRVSQEKNALVALLEGSLEGLGNGLVRFTAGVIELATAPLPLSTEPLYDKSLGQRAVKME